MGSDVSVAVLSVTPVKGLALHHPDHLDVSAEGVVGDRELFLVEPDGELISCTEIGELMAHRAEYDPVAGVLEVHGPDGLVRSGEIVDGPASSTDFYGLRTVAGHLVPEWDDVFSSIARRPVRLVHAEAGGFDVAGVTLLGSSSTRQLAERNDVGSVDARRFRMNVEIAGAQPHDEDTWNGRQLAVGDVVLRVGGPVKRCAATTRNPDTGVVDLQTLRMIRNARGRQETPEFGAGFYFGVYAEVLVPGRVHVGDEVALVD
jgi:uncharacterized protein